MDIKNTRQIFLDTETTGVNQTGVQYEGHKIIEIGAVESINRRLTGNNFHTYLKPNRLIDLEAFSIHGISDEFLLDKPTYSEVVDRFLEYIKDAEIIVHNASFDINFIDYESSKLNRFIPKIDSICKIIDTLSLARKVFPGKRNSLDSLCSRYKIDNSKRMLHGALSDAHILAEVYLAMTSFQTTFLFFTKSEENFHSHIKIQCAQEKLRIILANDEEMIAHRSYLRLLKEKSKNCLWYL